MADKPKGWQGFCAEWLDTLVVALSVAMAFRAYFYEPFNIPTGSMQPTLYGNHVEPCPKPGIVQKTPLKWIEWLLTGREYKEFVAPFSGRLLAAERNDGRFDMCVQGANGKTSKLIALPNDAIDHLCLPADRRYAPIPVGGEAGMRGLKSIREIGPGERPTVGDEVHVKKGDLVFAGYDTTGDFIFVNRWKWNFRKPKRGDVMVFATTGIDRLMQGTHYIKRLTALPGETVEIRTPDVFIDGRRLEKPLKPMTGRRGEPTPPPSPGEMAGPVKLGKGEYFACGDNSANSFDSRYWGPAPEANLRGTASCVFWPAINPRWGSVK